MANFTESSTFETTISGIDNGDPLNETELNNAAKLLTNRTKYLKDHVDILEAMGLIRKFGHTEGDSGPSVTHQTISGAPAENLSTADIVLTPAVGDKIIAIAYLLADHAGAASVTNEFSITKESASVANSNLSVAARTYNVHENGEGLLPVVVFGYWTATHAEATTFRVSCLNGNSGAGNLTIRDNWHFFVFVMKAPS